MKKFYTVVTDKAQADKMEKMLSIYSNNVRRDDRHESVTEIHFVADEATMERIVKEVRL